MVAIGRRPEKGSEDGAVVVPCAASMTSGHCPFNCCRHPFSYDRQPGGHPAMAAVVMPRDDSGCEVWPWLPALCSHRRGTLLQRRGGVLPPATSTGEAPCFQRREVVLLAARLGASTSKAQCFQLCHRRGRMLPPARCPASSSDWTTVLQATIHGAVSGR
jgi:hypothetical protein